MRGKYKNDMDTKYKLANALKELMKTKSFRTISIKDITSFVGVNRNTFYYHFEDINALIKWIIEEDTKDVKTRFDIKNHLEAFESILNYVDNNKDFLLNLEDSFSETNLKNLFFNEICEAVEYLINTEETKRHLTLNKTYKNFLCTFLANAIGSTFADYYLKDEKLSKKEVIHYYSMTIKSFIENIYFNN